MNEEESVRLEEAHDLVYKFVHERNISPGDYRYTKFVEYTAEKYKIKIDKISFGEYLDTLFCGTIICRDKQWLIHINRKLYLPRQNFTVCHELSHFIWDCEFGSKISSYASTMNQYEENSEIEFLANAAAGVIMLPDICLRDSFSKKLNFAKISNKFNISSSALKVRLMQFLIYHTSCPVNFAVEAVTKFQYDINPYDDLYFSDDLNYFMIERVDRLFENSIS